MSALLAAVTIENLVILGALVFLFGLLIGFWFRPQSMDEVTELEAEFQRLSDDRAELERRLHGMDGELMRAASIEEELEQIRSESSSLRLMLEQEQETRQAAEETVDGLREYARALEDQLREAGEHAKEHERLRKSLQETALQLSQLRLEHGQRLEESAHAERARGELERRTADLDQRNLELREEAAELTQLLEEQREQRAAVERQAQDRLADVQRLQDASREMEQALEQSRAEAEAMLRDQQDEANELRRHLSEIRSEMAMELQELRNRLQRETVERTEWELAAEERQETIERLSSAIEQRDLAEQGQDAIVEQLRSQYGELEQECNRLKTELSNERRARRMADSAIGQRVSEINQLSEAASALQRELEAAHAARDEQQQQMSFKLNELANRFAAEAQSRAEATDLARSREADIQRLQAQLERIGSEQERRRHEIGAMEERARQLQNNCEQAHTALRQERETRQKAELRCEAALAQAEQLVEEAEVLRSRTAGFEARLEGAHDDLRRVSLEREQARKMADSRQEAFLKASQRAERLGQDLESVRASSGQHIEELNGQRDRLQEAWAASQQQADAAMAALAQRDRETAQLKEQSELWMQRAELAAELEIQADQLPTIRTELEQVRESLAAARNETIRLNRRLDQEQANQEALQEQLAASRQLLELRDQHLAALRQLYEEAKTASSAGARRGPLIDDRRSSHVRHDEQTPQVEKTFVAENQTQIQEALEATMRQIRRLQQETEQVRLELGNHGTVAVPTAAHSTTPVSAPQGQEGDADLRADQSHRRPGGATSAEFFDEGFGPPSATDHAMHLDPTFGWVYSSPPAQRSELTRIQGITGPMEETLNSVGVYRFEQIMQWNEAQVEAFSRLFSSRAHIQGDWMGQAAEKVRRMRIQRRLDPGGVDASRQRRTA